MINGNALLTSIATLYFNNFTNEILKENTTNRTIFYLKNKSDEFFPIRIKNNNFPGVFFPKCCPPNYLYDLEYHKCGKAKNVSDIYDDFGFDINLIKTNLENCQVVVDRTLTEFKIKNFKSNRDFHFKNETFPIGNYCLDKLFDGGGYVARLCYKKEFCKRNVIKEWCLKKCCPDGEVLYGRSCISNSEFGLDVNGNSDVIERNDSIALYVDNRKCYQYTAPKSYFNFTIKSNGSFYIYEKEILKEYKVDDLMYCIDTHYNITTKQSKTKFRLCALSTENDIKFKLSKPAMIISCICFMATILVYIFVYKLRKVIEMIIVGYCFFSLVTYIILTIMQFLPNLGRYCELAGFTVFFSYVASLTWMNVISFDIYRTVGSMRVTIIQTKKSMFRKMLYYSLYAISIPAILTLLLYMGYKEVYNLPEDIYPRLEKRNCMFERKGYGHILHSAIPTGILIAVNIMFYIKTVRYYLKAKKDLKQITSASVTERRNRIRISHKKMAMVLKLSLVMGIPWIFEVIFLIIDFRQNTVLKIIAVIFDTFNCLQGLFVFLIFLVKWETIETACSKMSINNLFKKRTRNYRIQTVTASTSLHSYCK